MPNLHGSTRMAASKDIVPFTLPSVPLRPVDGHKGTFGKVLVIGGSYGMSGSVCLSSVAALRSGSGLVTVAVPKTILPIVAAFEPCVMTIGLLDEFLTGLLPQRTDFVREVIHDRDAIAIGPGLGRLPGAVQLVRDILEFARCPVVVDADGLNVAAEHGLFNGPRLQNLVITPHPGEFSRLTGRSIADIEQHREEIAQEYAAERTLIVVLKGPGTIVTDGFRMYRNSTGNSGMATGGSGDVLTGIVASLLGQGIPTFEATALAVHAHGLAGDIAAERMTRRGMIASDLLTTLPEAWRKLGSD